MDQAEITQSKLRFIKELVALHEALGRFQTYIARKNIIPGFESEEYNQIGEVAEIIEKEVNELKRS